MMRQLTAHQHDRRLLTATTTLQRVAGLLSLLTTAAAVHTAIARLPTVGHPHRPACLSRFQSGLPVNRSAGVAQVAQQLRHVSPGFRDAVPTPFEAPNGQRAVFCLIQKVGSTRWKQLLLKSVTGAKTAKAFEKPHGMQVHARGKPPWPPSEIEYPTVHALLNATVSRIVIVRSPYSRLLSAYMNKLAYGKYDNEELYGSLSSHSSINASSLTRSPSDFAAFVEDLHRIVQRFGWEAPRIDMHFTPMSRKCGIDAGLQYDYMLPVEWIGSWYPALVNMLGLQDVVKTGWRELSARARGKTATPQREDASLHDCFYSTERQSCESMQELIDSPPVKCSSSQETQGRQEQGADSGVFMDFNQATGAHGLLPRYYTPRLAQLVEDIFIEDFKHFNYKRLVLEE